MVQPPNEFKINRIWELEKEETFTFLFIPERWLEKLVSLHLG